MIRTLLHLAALLVLSAFGFPQALVAQTRWTKQEQLHARADHAMVYDPSGGRVLLLGGMQWESVYGVFDALWSYRAGSWSFVGRTPLLRKPSVAWDVARSTLFAYGSEFTSSGQVHLWNGAQWSSVALPLEASFADAIDLGYDPAVGAVLLVATHIAPARVEVFEWNGAAFTLRSRGAGPAWGEWQLVHEPATNRLLCIGSRYGGAVLETWSYGGSSWQQIATSGTPPARFGAGICLDPSTGRPLVACGHEIVNGSAVEKSDAWTLQGQAWQPSTALQVAPARTYTAMAGDASSGEVVLFGGLQYAASGTRWLGDTLGWNGSTWRVLAGEHAIGPRVIGATAYDSALRRTLAVTWTANATSTWEHDGRSWREIPTAVQPAHDSVAAFDPRSAEVVLVDGAGTTWLWSGVRWTIAATGHGASTNRALAWDGTRVVLVDGGQSGGAPATWFWSGSAWTAGSAAQSPPAGFAPRLAYDERRNVVALVYEQLYGGAASHYEWDGTRWSAIAATYPGRRFFAFAYHPARGRLVLAGGETWNPSTSQSTDLQDAYEYDGARWNQIAFLPHPGSAFFLGGSLVATAQDQLLWIGARDRGFHVAMESHLLDSVHGAEIERFEMGCGGAAGEPVFLYHPWQRPWMGQVFPLAAANLPPSATLIYGQSRETWSGIRLPLDLGSAGLPGCSILVAPDALRTLTVQSGVAAWVIPVPNLPLLLGAEVFEQIYAPDPTANPTGVVMSGGLALRVGVR